MEAFHVELATERGLSLASLFDDLNHADLVAGGLSGQRYVAAHLRPRSLKRLAARDVHVFHGFILGPAESMNASIDHQPCRAAIYANDDGNDDNGSSNMEKRETEKRGMGGEGEKGCEETTVGGLGMSYNNQIFKRKEGGAGG